MRKIVKINKTLRFSMFDFIDAIRQNSVLWDRTHPSFHNRDTRESTWMEIGRSLIKNFNELSPAEKENISDVLAKRWKNVRDSFGRILRLKQNGNDVKSYIYEKELSFLLPFHKSNITATDDEHTGFGQTMTTCDKNATTSTKREQSAETVNDLKQVKKRRESDDEFVIENAMNAFDEASCNSPHSRENVNDEGSSFAVDSLQEPLMNLPVATSCAKESRGVIIENLVIPSSSNVQRNDDILGAEAFIDSIKPFVRRIHPDFILDFQIDCLKLIKNYQCKKVEN